MAVHIDAAIPVHPLTVSDVARMVEAGILTEDERIELLDGVLVEMSPPGPAHSHALRELMAIVLPVAWAEGLRAIVQDPLALPSSISQPQPDLAVVPAPPRGGYASDPLLLVEIAQSSRGIDLGRKAAIYAEGRVPEYWVLDIERRELVVHRDPVNGGYTSVRTAHEDETVSALGLDCAVSVSALL
jgi:Uma2 family endonuclease